MILTWYFAQSLCVFSSHWFPWRAADLPLWSCWTPTTAAIVKTVIQVMYDVWKHSSLGFWFFLFLLQKFNTEYIFSKETQHIFHFLVHQNISVMWYHCQLTPTSLHVMHHRPKENILSVLIPTNLMGSSWNKDVYASAKGQQPLLTSYIHLLMRELWAV